MKAKQTVKILIAGLVLILGLVIVTPVLSVSAAECDPATQSCCGGVDTSIINCDEKGQGGIEDSGVWGILLLAINVLTAGIGIAAVGGIVYGAILYTSAGGSQEQTKKAIGIITNVVIGVVAYALMFAALNFLIPGGIFR
jgi:hypothetical protein